MDQLIPVAGIVGVTVVLAVIAWQVLSIPREAARHGDGNDVTLHGAVDELRRRVDVLEQRQR
jgi:hypothetical protein